MGARLEDMTLEELWELFPIELVEHQSAWARQYAELEKGIRDVLDGFDIVRISHIGSTAVAGIQAKPIVDVLVELDAGGSVAAVASALEEAGFIKMSEGPRRASLNLGYTENGFAGRVCHVHVRGEGDNDELYFRDYLIEHPEVAKEYERLKLGLWRRFSNDRDAYTEAKGGFVREATARARASYGDRYA